MYVNNTKSMSVTRSLAMSQDSAGAMVCIKGIDFGRQIILKSDKKLMVGRSSELCNYTIADAGVSRKHFEITYIGSLNKYRIIDYSSNGTYVNPCSRTTDDYVKLINEKEYYLGSMAEIRLGASNNVYKLR